MSPVGDQAAGATPPVAASWAFDPHKSRGSGHRNLPPLSSARGVPEEHRASELSDRGSTPPRSFPSIYGAPTSGLGDAHVSDVSVVGPEASVGGSRGPAGVYVGPNVVVDAPREPKDRQRVPLQETMASSTGLPGAYDDGQHVSKTSKEAPSTSAEPAGTFDGLHVSKASKSSKTSKPGTFAALHISATSFTTGDEHASGMLPVVEHSSMHSLEKTSFSIENQGDTEMATAIARGKEVADARIQRRRLGAQRFSLFCLFMTVSGLSAGVIQVPILRRAFPLASVDGSDHAASWWRGLQVILESITVGGLLAGPFAYAFRIRLNVFGRISLATGLARGAFAALGNFYWNGDESDMANAVRSIAWAGQVISSNLPLIVVLWAKYKPRHDATRQVPVMRWFYMVIMFTTTVSGIASFWVPGVGFLALLGFVVLPSASLFDGRNETRGSVWYCGAISIMSFTTPVFVVAVLAMVTDLVDPESFGGSIVIVLSFSLVMSLLHSTQVALTARAVPPQHRTATLFAQQVFEDVFAEFLFVQTSVFSAGYFVFLGGQILRTIGRDAGFYDEMSFQAWRVLYWLRGARPPRRQTDQLIGRVRTWLQNFISEVSSIFVFVGAIIGEELQGDQIGTLTGVGPAGRRKLLLGYFVVLLVEFAAHSGCYVWFRRQVHIEHATALAAETLSQQLPRVSGASKKSSGRSPGRSPKETPRMAHTPRHLRKSVRRNTVQSLKSGQLSFATEASKLVLRNAIYFLACAMFATQAALAYSRLRQVEYW